MTNTGGSPQPGPGQPDPRNPFSYLTDKERAQIGRAAKANYWVAQLQFWLIVGPILLFVVVAVILVGLFFLL